MPTLTIPNVPAPILEYLAAEAARTQRTVEEEALAMLSGAALLRPGNDDTGPLNFPRPLEGPDILVKVSGGGERLPMPLVVEDTLPE